MYMHIYIERDRDIAMYIYIWYDGMCVYHIIYTYIICTVCICKITYLNVYYTYSIIYIYTQVPHVLEYTPCVLFQPRCSSDWYCSPCRGLSQKKKTPGRARVSNIWKPMQLRVLIRRAANYDHTPNLPTNIIPTKIA